MHFQYVQRLQDKEVCIFTWRRRDCGINHCEPELEEGPAQLKTYKLKSLSSAFFLDELLLCAKAPSPYMFPPPRSRFPFVLSFVGK